MAAKRIAIFKQGPGIQRGGVLLVMLVILVIGAAALLVGALNSSALQIARDKTTADALAQAKDALIGRAASDANVPGSFPCPDQVTNISGNIPDDGIADLLTGNDCPSYIGRLPWKTLGLTELRDGYGEHLWYALSRNFRDAPNNYINSDTQGTLNIIGTQTVNNVVAIIFSAGNPLSGQSRSTTQMATCTTTNSTIAASLCATNYLEGSNGNLSNATTQNTSYQTAAATSTFNDQPIFITHDQIMSVVERRIAREAKACLDSYAAMPVWSNGNAPGLKYPWAAPVADSNNNTTFPWINGNYNGTYGKYFGRIPAQPNIETTSTSSSDTTLMTALNTLQAAEAAYNSSGSAANQTALNNAANAVIGLKYSVSNVSSSTIDQAGDYGNYFANGTNTYATATSYLNSAVSAVGSYLDLSMSITWPSTCTILNNPSSYFWAAWKNLVFYQVAGVYPNGYQPGSSASFGVPLTINGTGAYRATVLVARAAINSTQLSARSSPGTNPPTPYLEGINPHYGSTPTTTFNTYSPSVPSYSTVNDLVLCLDGKGTNPGSVCP